MEVTPKESSIRISKLISKSYSKRKKGPHKFDAVNFKRPLYNYNPENSEQLVEVVDPVYLPEQIKKITKYGEYFEPIKEFIKDEKEGHILIRDLVSGQEIIVQY